MLLLLLFLTPTLAAPWPRHTIDNSSKGADGTRLADVNGDGLPDITTGWEQGGLVRVYLNPGPVKAKEKWPAVSVGKAGSVEDAVFADLDNDGAMDVISSSEGKTRALWIHWAPKEKSRYLDSTAWKTEPLPASTNRMMWMFTLPMQIDGRHGIDLFAGGKGDRAELGWWEAPRDARQLSEWQWHPLRPLGWLMSLVASDMDGDGDQDLVFTDRKQKRAGCFWLENPGPGPAQSKPWKEHLIGGAGKEVMFLHLADLDQDGLQDVLIATKPQTILFCRRQSKDGTRWETRDIPMPAHAGGAKGLNVGDLNLNGRLDVIYSCEGAKPPLQGVGWLAYQGPLTDNRWTPHPISGADGVKHDLVQLIDLDGDGDLDVLTCEETTNLGVIWYENPTR
ncbi:MAG: VCBS repeat-containing protein [Verrucomicrobiota bacterium]